MKRIILSFFCLLITFSSILAQTLYTKTDTIPIYADSVLLTVPDNIRGEIIWQKSIDGNSWEDLNNENSENLLVHPINDGIYRAKITEGTCEPVYSDTLIMYNNADIVPAWVKTQPVTKIQPYGATLYGKIISNGKGHIKELGFCYASNQNPTVNDNKQKTTNNDFSITIDDLLPENKYYTRAYAINEAGISYGNEQYFTTLSEKPSNIVFNEDKKYGIVKDIDGNRYKTIKVGTQTWMAENLRVTRNNQGGDLRYEENRRDWPHLDNIPAYCWYDNNEENKAEYGALYNWYCINQDNLCPLGWKVPSTEDWDTLIEYIGGDNLAGKLKETTDKHWSRYLESTDNSTGFTALPGGGRNLSGLYYSKGEEADFWYDTGSNLSKTKRMNFYTEQIIDGIGDRTIGASVRCIKDENVYTIPTVSTTAVTNITQTSATIDGNITNNGGKTITEQGVCWNTAGNPNQSDNKIVNSEGTGIFSTLITNLKSNTTYYVRAYAINFVGVAYGEEVSFTTAFSGYFTDSRDGHEYKVVKIGEQLWMAENLAFLPDVSPSTEGISNDPSYYVYNYSGNSVSDAKATENYQNYGVLYNWSAATNACPNGWHLPDDEEWKQFEIYLGMSEFKADDTSYRGTEGDKLKAINGWKTNPYFIGLDEYEFSALPGGCRSSTGFIYEGSSGYWWSATEAGNWDAMYRALHYSQPGIDRYDNYKTNGYSVRCIKD